MLAYLAYIVVGSFILYIIYGAIEGNQQCRMGVAAFIAIIVMAAVSGCFGETVIAVFYEDDTFIVEDEEGNLNLYEDRGDLVPGDIIEIKDGDIKLVSQTNWVWFDFAIEEQRIASFLYAEDAKWIIEIVLR